MTILVRLVDLHNRAFGAVQAALEPWVLGLLARFVFASVLFLYFYNSFLTKIGEGVFGFLHVTDGAYIQIMAPVLERYNYDASQVPFIPYGLVVYLGTYAEFLLPVAIIIGLFSRISAFGMIIFIAVQTYVDITVHKVGAQAIGHLFDRIPDAPIADQRTLWVFLLSIIVIKGPGSVSVDWVLGRWFASKAIKPVGTGTAADPAAATAGAE